MKPWEKFRGGGLGTSGPWNKYQKSFGENLSAVAPNPASSTFDTPPAPPVNQQVEPLEDQDLGAPEPRQFTQVAPVEPAPATAYAERNLADDLQKVPSYVDQAKKTAGEIFSTKTWNRMKESFLGGVQTGVGGTMERLAGLRTVVREKWGDEGDRAFDIAYGGALRKLEKLAGPGREIADLGVERQQAAQDPNAPWLANQLVGAAGSAPSTAAGIAAGLVTRSPNVGIAVASTLGEGTTYDQAKRASEQRVAQGLAPIPESELQAYSAQDQLIEMFTERLPTEILLKRGTPLFKRLVRFTSAEVPGEVAATVFQQKLAERYKVSEPLTPAEWRTAIADTIAQTLILAAPSVAVGHSANKPAKVEKGLPAPEAYKAPEKPKQITGTVEDDKVYGKDERPGDEPPAQIGSVAGKLPAPKAGKTIVVDKEGVATPMTEGEEQAIERQRAEREELGYGPLKTGPSPEPTKEEIAAERAAAKAKKAQEAKAAKEAEARKNAPPEQLDLNVETPQAPKMQLEAPPGEVGKAPSQEESEGREMARILKSIQEGKATEAEQKLAIESKNAILGSSGKVRILPRGLREIKKWAGTEPARVGGSAGEKASSVPATESGTKEKISEPSKNPEVQESSTGLTEALGGAGKAITENFYKAAFAALQGGKTRIAGVKDPVLARAKPAYAAGLIKTPEDIQRFENEGYPKAEPQEKPKVATVPSIPAQSEGPAASLPGLEQARARTNVNPTEAQKAAGNYAKGELTFGGLKVAIENPRGSVRSFVTDDNSIGHRVMEHDYGYVKGAEGADGDKVDVFLTGKPDTGKVFVIDQHKADGSFDEHKVILGASSAKEALDTYKANYPKGWKRYSKVTTMTTEAFAQKARSGGFVKKGSDLKSFMKEKLAAREASRKNKPRLAETARDLYDAIVEKTERGVPTDQGIMYPVVRVVGLGDFEVKKDGIRKMNYGNVQTTSEVSKKLEAEIRDAIERDLAQVVLRTRWGGSGEKGSRDFAELHNPSARSFKPPMTQEEAAATLEELRRNRPKTFRRKASQTQTKSFKDWFGKSKIVDAKGKPLRVYHGTVTDFESFDPSRGNVESDMGAGLYFSNTHEDVEKNYAGFGPDITGRMEYEQERIEQNYEYDDNIKEMIDRWAEENGFTEAMLSGPYLTDVAKAYVRQKFATHEGATMPVYLKMENPFVIGGKETELTYEFSLDDDGDTSDESGTLVDFIMALRNNVEDSERFDGADVGAFVTSVIDHAIDNDGIKAGPLLKLFYGSEGLGYITDTNGKISNRELFRQTLEDIGFDGIIDNTVSRKFKSMKGIDEDTVHYIVFKPEQVKSAVGNKGTFDPQNPSIIARRKLAEQLNARNVQVQNIIKKITGRMYLPKISVDVFSRETLPDFLRQSLAMSGDPEFTKTEGFFYPGIDGNGRVVIISDNIESDEHLETILMHEIVGHYGLRQILGDNYNSIMDEIAEALPDKVRESRLRNNIDSIPDITEDEKRRLSAEEYIAYTAEQVLTGKTVDKSSRNLLQRVVDALKNAFRAIFDNERWQAENKVMDLISRASNYVNTPDGFARHVKTLRRHAKQNFYSQVLRTVSNAKMKTATGKQWMGWLRNQQGIKEEEIRWLGLEEYLDDPDNSKKIDRDALSSFIASNEVKVDEKIYGQVPIKSRSELEAIASKHNLFLKNYRDHIYVYKDWTLQGDPLTAFEVPADLWSEISAYNNYPDNTQYSSYTLPGGSGYTELLFKLDRSTSSLFGEQYTSSHFTGDRSNDLLMHVRFNEHIDTDGKRVLFIEEVQSDWHQEGKRKGYKTIPNAPFKTTWPELGIKRMIRWAAQNGFDRVAWTTGEQQADRYQLRERIVALDVEKHYKFDDPDKVEYDVRYVPVGSRREFVSGGTFKEHELASAIGKDFADKVIADLKEKDVKGYRGLDLNFGGQGMRGFYDEILVTTANKLIKKFGSKVSKTDIVLNPDYTREDMLGADQSAKDLMKQVGEATTVHAFDVTDSMRQTASGGFPLFHRRTETQAQTAARGNAINTGTPGFESSRWSLRNSSWWNELVFKAQDKFIYLLRSQEDAAAYRNQARVDESQDAYMAQTLYHGRAEDRMDKYQKKFIDPLVKAIKDSGYTWGQVEDFLYARHAPEANDWLLKINNGDKSFNSGMTDDEAKQIMRDLASAGDVRKLSAIGDMVDAMTKWNRETMVAEGLMDQDVVDIWEDMYEHYVPLKGFKDSITDAEETYNLPKRGKGFDTGGKLTKHRLGRRSVAANILANVVAQAHSTIIMAEKAKVGRAFFRFANANQDPELWTIEPVKVERYLDENTGMVRERVVTSGQMAARNSPDNIMRVKIGGQDYHIVFNEENHAAMRIAYAMKNLGADQMNNILSFLHGINRFLSTVNTSLNPEFVITNLARDLQTAGINLQGHDVDGFRAKVFTDWRKAWRGIEGAIGGTGLKPTEWSEHWEDFKAHGGKVGWIDDYKNVKSLEARLKSQVEDGNGVWHWSKIAAGGIKEFIENRNLAVENAIRLATYVNAQRAGLSKARSAEIAKNLTVNFNRRGDWGVVINSLYLFANANIQGTATILRSVKNKRARRFVYGLVALGIAQAIINGFLGGDDEDDENMYDKISEAEKERNMVLVLPPSWRFKIGSKNVDYLKVPLPYGFNAFYYLGTKLGSAIDYYTVGNHKKMDGFKDSMEAAVAFIDAFNPLGTSPSLSQLLAPTFADPFVQLSENKDFAGRPIEPENAYDQTPDPHSQRYFKSANEASVAIADSLNRMSGGDEITPGRIDISPEWIDHLWNFSLGGVGKFLANTANTTHDLIVDRKELETNNLPFVRKVIGSVGEQGTRDAFYENILRIRRAQETYEAAVNAPNADEAQEKLAALRSRYPVEMRFIDPEPGTGQRTDMQEVLSEIKRARQDIKAIKAAGLPERIQNERVRAVEKQINTIMLRFNKAVNDAQQRDKESGRLTDRLDPIIEGKAQDDAVAALRKADLPATADLVAALPVRVNKKVAEVFRNELA